MLDKDLPITGTALTPLFFTYREGLDAYLKTKAVSVNLGPHL